MIKSKFCDDLTSNCTFELVKYIMGKELSPNYKDVHSIVFCQVGQLTIISNLFSETVLCAGEHLFIPRMCEYKGMALDDTTLIIHSFNNTVCRVENCILSYLHTYRHYSNSKETSDAYPKLAANVSLLHLWESISIHLSGNRDNPTLWKMKHRELIWLLTQHYSTQVLCSFFQPMMDEQVPFKSLVLSHYRKIKYTQELADLCGYGIGSFRRRFKREFGTSVFQWLIRKKAEHILFRLSQPRFSFTDIVDEFEFSSIQHFSRFCKQYLEDTPTNIRKKYIHRQELYSE